MRKKIGAVFLLFTLLFSVAALGVSAAEEKRVVDLAGLFTEEEIAALEAETARLIDRWNMDFVIVTTDDAEGKSAMAYADDFYDYGGYGIGGDDRGVLFLIDMDNREAWISTTGAAIDLYTDTRIDSILDDIFLYLPNEAYGDAAFAFLNSAEDYAEKGVPKNHYRYDAETGKIIRTYSISWQAVVIGLAAGLAAGGIFAGVMVYRYSRNGKAAPYPFRQQSRMQLTRSEDQFLGSSVTSRHIDTSSGGGHSSGGGGSSVHRSSSGRSHGGGGRSF